MDEHTVLATVGPTGRVRDQHWGIAMTTAFASPGSMNVDWEERVERRSAADVPARRAPAAPSPRPSSARCPALRLQQHPLRHEHPHRRVGPRQDDPLRAADAAAATPHIWDFGSAAKHHRLNCPWLRPGEHPRRDGRPARRGRPGRRPVPGGRARDPRHPQGRGRRRHAARRRHRRAADARGARGRGHHGPRRASR